MDLTRGFVPVGIVYRGTMGSQPTVVGSLHCLPPVVPGTVEDSAESSGQTGQPDLSCPLVEVLASLREAVAGFWKLALAICSVCPKLMFRISAEDLAVKN